MNKGTLSRNLSRLEEAGYVQVSKTFRGKVPQNLFRLTAPAAKPLNSIDEGSRSTL